MIILPTNSDLSIEQVLLDDQVTLLLRSTALTADCPDCETPSRRLHSHSHRKPSDLPVSGHPVRLIIERRRFFCDKATCPRKTFAQQIPSLLGPHAQRTTRLQETLQGLGLALGGEAGARLATKLGMPAHPESLLRLVRQATPAQREPAKIIGRDDWAGLRRLRYGTLICDLERGVPVDVLPDRDAAPVIQWLEQPPQVQVISRDRWGEYARAAQRAAPQAVQVADRWHLLQNLVQSLTDLLAHSHAQMSQHASDPISVHEAQAPRMTSLPTANKQAPSATVQRRQDQFVQVQRLLGQGCPVAQIARHVGISQRTLYRWLERAEVPQGHLRVRRHSVIDRYKN